MTTTWFVVANAARARICAQDEPGGRLREVGDYVHPASRQSGAELGTERPGQGHRGQGATAPGGTAFEPRADVHRKEHERFARELAQAVSAGLAAGKVQALVVAASSPFLGELKAQLGPAASQALVSTLAHDLTALDLRELGQRLAELTQPAH